MYDNRIFNVNGVDKETLIVALVLAQKQAGLKHFEGFRVDKEKGLVLYGYSIVDKATKFLVPISGAVIADMVWVWLEGAEAKSIPLDGWDVDHAHDGDNGKAWRVYCEDWGHVGSDSSAIVAIKPVYAWYGK